MFLAASAGRSERKNRVEGAFSGKIIARGVPIGTSFRGNTVADGGGGGADQEDCDECGSCPSHGHPLRFTTEVRSVDRKTSMISSLIPTSG